MNKITYDDLVKWECENEESLIADGPWWFTDEQEKIFVNRINERKDILDFLGVESVEWRYDIMVMLNGGMSEEQIKEGEKYRDIVYTMFADFLNDIGYNKKYLI